MADAGEIQSFSQHGQDRFVYETLFKGRAEPGIFVDVGAYDGVTYSNTLLLERCGWRGICIEPIPAAFEKLKASRSAICVNCAVADRAGDATFVEVEMPAPYERMYSGLKANFDEHHAKVIRDHGSSLVTYKVAVRTLREILTAYGLTRVDYLSIDTEGSEWKIVRDFDFTVFGVAAVSIENNARDDKLRRHMAQRGYRLVKSFGGFDDLFFR